MPKYQGELDGLCGIYAVANAFEFCFGKDAERSFQICCESLAQSRWPNVIWEGTTFGDVLRMISACRRDYNLHSHMIVRWPFRQGPRPKNSEYWTTFQDIFSRPNAQCALMGISKPIAHWILATPHRSGMLFLDSTAGSTLKLVKQDQFYAGLRRPDQSMFLLDPRELIIFEKREK